MLAQSMQVTNINDVAASYSDAFADVLVRVMRDEHVHSESYHSLVYRIDR